MGHDLLANLLGAWSEELSLGAILLRVALSALFAAVIGCERSSKRHSAGLRTFILVSIAGVSAMLIDQWLMAFSGVKLPVLSAAAVVGMATISGNSILFSSRNQICRSLVLRTAGAGARRGAVYAGAGAVSGAALQYVGASGAGKAPQGPLEPL